MKKDLKIVYRQDYLPSKRHKKSRTAILAGTVEVTIEEPSATDFPVAFRVTEMTSVQEGMKSYKDYDSDKCKYILFTEDIRTHGGKFFKPVRVTHGAAISTLFESIDEVWKTINRISIASWAYYEDHPNELPTDALLIGNSTRAESEELLLRTAAQYLIFDGLFWKECGEPRYRIATFGMGNNHGGTALFIEWYSNDQSYLSGTFSALQKDEAVAYGKRVALDRGDTDYVEAIGKYDVIEVLMPDMVTPPKEMRTMEDPMKIIEPLFEALQFSMKPGMWSDGERILCDTSEKANAIADLLEAIADGCGEKITVVTGYYDSAEERERDDYTGYHYVKID